MAKKILIIDGHPDAAPARLCHALSKAYADGAHKTGHVTKTINVAELDFDLLTSKQEFETGNVCSDIKTAQEEILWADHIVIIYPLWLGGMPALLKGFFEQVLRPGFAFAPDDKLLGGKLRGRTARVVVTMGMPVFIYRWFFFAHTLKALNRNILKFCGISPVRHTLLGNIENTSLDERKKWLEDMHIEGIHGT